MRISRRLFLGGAGATASAAAFGQVPTAGGNAPPGTAVRLNRPQLPLLRSGDAVVAGGSLAGVALALDLAGHGRKVILVESRTYLGREICACLRPWLPAGERPPGVLESAAFADRGGSEVPLKMDHVKLALEDAVLSAGIDLLYGCFPVALCAGGLVVANKSGRQVVQSALIVDATETAVVARCAGAAFEAAPGRARYRRTLEYDDAGECAPGEFAVPSRLQLADDRVIFRRGYRGGGHLQVEFALDLPVGEYTHESWMAREIEARRRSFALAVYLASHHPAFRKAFLAHASYELDGPATARMAGPAPEWARRLPPLETHERMDVAAFATPLPGVWCLEAARLSGGQAASFSEPAAKLRLGEALSQALRAAGKRAISPGPFSPPSVRAQNVLTGMEVSELDCPQPGRAYTMTAVEAADVPVVREVDVLVAGGGTSGATAAAVAAGEGVRTLVLEMNPALGGTGTIAGVDSYWFGRQVGFAARLDARVRTAERSIGYEPGKSPHPKWNIEAKMHTLLEQVSGAGAAILFRTIVAGSIVERGNRVRGVLAATPYGLRAVLAKVVIDATGDGDVAAFAGAEFVAHSAMNHVGMWHNFAQFQRPGRNMNHFTSSVEIANIEDCNRAILAGRRRGGDCHDHGIYVAPRESRHILGDAVLTLTDLLRQRAWPDVVSIHYGNSDMKGKPTSQWMLTGLIPPNLDGEISYRMTVPKGIENVLVAGKAFSATHDALAGVRFQADLENLGGTLALAAAKAVKENRTPRDIDVSELQRRLVREGVLPETILTRRLAPCRHSRDRLRELVAAMLSDRPLLAYQREFAEHALRQQIPFVEVCACGPRAVPLLIEALEAHPAHRLLIAQALAHCGSKAGVEVLVAELERSLADRLPPRANNILHANLPPDQGAMPDTAYLLYCLGLARDRRALPVWRRVAGLLRPEEQQFRSRTESPYHYVDAVCYGAERLGDPAAIPILESLHSHSLLRDQNTQKGFQVDFMLERRAMLELAIARALARCGSAKGYAILIAYLDDNRACLAEHAHLNLVRLSGQDWGMQRASWEKWLVIAKSNLEPCPLIEDLDVVFEREILVSV